MPIKSMLWRVAVMQSQTVEPPLVEMSTISEPEGRKQTPVLNLGGPRL